ncbi:hypothetical protein [Streptomyces candidus]|uniref:Uncharacterized protein n=1 Tax=Streptomyces candidus TaxID=67283 RepID=A0A7X0HME3_9ACTN|nr:hypothetical protein [Streptomyces candidus]MBB6439042.1 hypothetical protein [Streptomyces candidus]GHH55427.1 hypothetical protein GCM10018773_59800 [Streptomyces candidus]
MNMNATPTPYTGYEDAFASLAATQRGRPPASVVPLLRRAANRALLEFTENDLQEQAAAISSGALYGLRVAVN